MSYRFTLQVTRVECLGEAALEWGKDEMHLIGFGVTRKGHVITTGYRGLGSYETGDVNAGGGFPMTLYQAELEDDGLDVVLYLWLIEEDGGGVAGHAAELDAEFRASYLAKATTLNEVSFPRECIPFTAFYKSIPSLESSLEEAATDGLNDEVFFPALREGVVQVDRKIVARLPLEHRAEGRARGLATVVDVARNLGNPVEGAIRVHIGAAARRRACARGEQW